MTTLWQRVKDYFARKNAEEIAEVTQTVKIDLMHAYQHEKYMEKSLDEATETYFKIRALLSEDTSALTPLVMARLEERKDVAYCAMCHYAEELFSIREKRSKLWHEIHGCDSPVMNNESRESNSVGCDSQKGDGA